MNIIDVQDQLKNFSEQQLVREMQAPSGAAPQYLVLSEISRRKRMRDAMAASAGAGDQKRTVADEVVAAAGVPQAGIGQMARTMAPKTDISANGGIAQLMPGPARMASGGRVTKMQTGGVVVRNGRQYVQGPDGTLVDTVTGMPLLQDFGGTAARLATAGMGSPGQMYRDSLVEGALARDDAPPVDLDLTSVNPSYSEDRPDRFADQPIPPSLPELGSPIPPPPYNFLDYSYGLPLVSDRARNNMPPEFQPAPNSGVVTPQDYAAMGAQDLAMPVGGSWMQESFAPLPPAGGEGFDARSAVAPEPAPYGSGWMAGEANTEETWPGWYDMLFPPEPVPPGAGGFEARSGVAAMADEAEAAAAEKRMRAEADAIIARGLTENAVNPAEAGEAAPSETETVSADPASEMLLGSDAAGGGGGGGGGTSPLSSYEQELVDAIKRSEERAEQDKWLSVAQAGLALMSSTQPTLGGAIGEAGAQGIAAFRESRDSAEAERMKLLEAQFGIQMARQKMAASGGGRGGGGSGGGMSRKDVMGEIEALNTLAADLSIPEADRLYYYKLARGLRDSLYGSPQSAIPELDTTQP